MVQPPSTPFLQVDVGRLEANLARMAAAAADAGVALRPHAKTHKAPRSRGCSSRPARSG